MWHRHYMLQVRPLPCLSLPNALICSRNPSQGQSPASAWDITTLVMTIERAKRQQCKRDRPKEREKERVCVSEREGGSWRHACLLAAIQAPCPIQFHYQNDDDDDDDDVSCMKHKFIFKCCCCCLSCSARSCENRELDWVGRHRLRLPGYPFCTLGLGCICIFPASSFFSLFFFLSFFSRAYTSFGLQHSTAQRSVAFIASSVFLGALLFSTSPPPLLLLLLVVFFTYAHYQVACSCLTDCSDEAAGVEQGLEGQGWCLRARELAN